MKLLLLALLVLVAACSASSSPPDDPAPPICHGSRVFVLSPAASSAWGPAILWAFDRWRIDVPELGAASLVVSTSASSPAECFSPVELVDFEDAATLGESRGGVLLLARSSSLTDDGRRALVLHELGHLVFRLGHSTDRASVMWRVIQHAPPPLTPADVAAARAALGEP